MVMLIKSSNACTQNSWKVTVFPGYSQEETTIYGYVPCSFYGLLATIVLQKCYTSPSIARLGLLAQTNSKYTCSLIYGAYICGNCSHKPKP